MTLEDFAKLVFAKVNQPFESLEARNYETQLFNSVRDHVFRVVISESGATEFALNFIPKMVYTIDQEGSPRPSRYVFHYPESLIELLDIDFERYPDIGVGYIPALLTSRTYSEFYDMESRRKLIASNRARPMLYGTFGHSDLTAWSPLALETAATFAGFYLCGPLSKSDSLRDKLEAEYEKNISKLKVYDTGKRGGFSHRQSSSWTDPIDFNLGGSIPPYPFF